MPIADAKKRRIGRELTDWIYLGIRTGARRSTLEYQTLKQDDPINAKAVLERAVNMPRRARTRINEWITTWDGIHGTGEGVVFLADCLSLAGTITIAEINAELTTLEAQAQTIIDHNLLDGWTLDQIATAIENALEWEAKDWIFPLPESYSDIGLVDN